MPKYTVSSGDSITSIAHENGFLSKTIWDHPENAGLKAKRKDPNILFPGDEVFIPDKDLKWETRPTNAKHVFQVKGEPNKFKLRLMKLGQPRANEAYVLEIDGKLYNGSTDSNGMLEQVIPRDAKGGKLVLKGGKETYPVRIGYLDPIDEVSGIQHRLNNLGFNCGSPGGELNDETRDAIRQFQTKYKLEVTGEPDDATKAKLRQLHG